MKKNLFTLVLMLTALNAGAQDLEYSFDNATRTAKVTYRMRQLGDGTWERIQGGYHGDIVIPEEVSGYTVTGVGELAFDQCYDVTSVKFPNTMKSIEERAFCGCKILKEVSIPASVDTIYNNAFDGCESLEKVVFEDGENVLKLGVGSSSAESGMFSRNHTLLLSRRSAPAVISISGHFPAAIFRQCSLPMLPIPIIPSLIFCCSIFCTSICVLITRSVQPRPGLSGIIQLL